MDRIIKKLKAKLNWKDCYLKLFFSSLFFFSPLIVRVCVYLSLKNTFYLLIFSHDRLLLPQYLFFELLPPKKK